MTTLHDPTTRAALKKRLLTLTPAATGKWGKMSGDQMLWHVNQALRMALGKDAVAAKKTPVPPAIMRMLVLNIPWPKGAPTAPELVPKTSYDFNAERQRCMSLVDEMGAKNIDGPWPVHPVMGQLKGKHWSKLQAKHIDHHLRQFGA